MNDRVVAGLAEQPAVDIAAEFFKTAIQEHLRIEHRVRAGLEQGRARLCAARG